MSSTKSLLVELFVEELPPKSLKKLGDAFAATLAASLKAQGLATDHSAVTAYATPRRLAMHLSAVAAQGTDKAVTHKLMPVTVALDASGTPTPALLKKLAAVGADASVVPQLERKQDGKAEALFWSTTVRGATLAAGLQVALDDALAKLPILKVMSYQLDDGWTSVNFVRPAHGLVALHGAEVVEVRALGLTSGRNTQGHRFEAQMTPVVLQDADRYAQQLETQGAVIAAFDHRRADIARQLQHAAAPLGLVPIDDDALLDEVTALVERPNVLLCEFEQEFLAVPSECLILTMKANQKYFPLLDAQGKLTNKFLVVSNIRPEDPSAIVQGNERVVRPRLADAKFFFDQDRKKTLASRLPMLDKVVYHAKLGSQGERVERVRAIARAIGNLLGGAALSNQADRAAQLAKTDLVTDMVGEFPELQGIMGGYYARHDGETDVVACAIEDHYKPRFSGDALPRNQVGVAVALADKLETLGGLFSVGERPTGDKDPFAMRRHALGVIRMLIERNLPLAMPQLGIAVASAPRPNVFEIGEFTGFMYDRLVGYLRELGYSAREVDAVVSVRPPRWAELPKRLEAVRTFGSLAESESLAAANKRIANILKQAYQKGEKIGFPDGHNFGEKLESDLHAALKRASVVAGPLFEKGDYTGYLKSFAVLRQPVDAFFEGIMVMVDDPHVRQRRLDLLYEMEFEMNRVADIARLAS
jgi:glycyl-tRNA synthetase beta chain